MCMRNAHSTLRCNADASSDALKRDFDRRLTHIEPGETFVPLLLRRTGRRTTARIKVEMAPTKGLRF